MAGGRHAANPFGITTVVVIVVGIAYAVLRFGLIPFFPALGDDAVGAMATTLLVLWLGSILLWVAQLARRTLFRPAKSVQRKSRATTVMRSSMRNSTMQSQWQNADPLNTWADTNHDTRERRSGMHSPGVIRSGHSFAHTNAIPTQSRQLAQDPAMRHPAAPVCWTLDLLQELEWCRFEEVCVGFLRMLGMDAVATNAGPAGDANLSIRQSASAAPHAVGRTRAGVITVEVERVRALYAVLVHDQLKQAFFLTSASFSAQASAAGRGVGMILMDGPTMLKRIQALAPQQQEALLETAVRGDFRSPTCPACRRRMVLRSGDFKSFWRCTGYPECKERMAVSGDGTTLS